MSCCTKLPLQTPVIFGRAAGRPDEQITVKPLGEAEQTIADMATCIIDRFAGDADHLRRAASLRLVYTPRSMAGGNS